MNTSDMTGKLMFIFVTLLITLFANLSVNDLLRLVLLYISLSFFYIGGE